MKNHANFKILDCTLRDGGYYNGWDFDDDLVFSLFESLEKSGVDIVEVGYKSLANKGFSGKYKYCPESQLQFLKQFPSIEYAFMLDVKEFISDGQVDYQKLDQVIIPESESVFSWCRLASYIATMESANEIATYLKKKGYRTCLNFMAISLLSETDLTQAIAKIDSTAVDVLYFADSFGNFVPEDISKYVGLFKSIFSGSIGFHAHDNQGLAYANALAAIQEGVEYIDGTVYGMGRGAGNLKTEQLLLSSYVNFNHSDRNAYLLLDTISKFFEPLCRKYGWGADFIYTLSGMENIHPTYCQELKSSHQYSMAQVVNILNLIPTEARKKFEKGVLIEAINKEVSGRTPATGTQESLPAYVSENSDTVLVVANGPSVTRHKQALGEYIQSQQCQLVECNNTGVLGAYERIIAVLNSVRLEEVRKENMSNVTQIVAGVSTVESLNENERIVRQEYSLTRDHFSIDNNKLSIPSFYVGVYAIGVALRMKPKKIVLAGFDGFDEENTAKLQEKQQMEKFWEILFASKEASNVEIFSILPSLYDIPTQSVYGLIKNV